MSVCAFVVSARVCVCVCESVCGEAANNACKASLMPLKKLLNHTLAIRSNHINFYDIS